MFCAAAVVYEQHLVWHREISIQMVTVHIAASHVTLVKTQIPVPMSFIFLLQKMS